MKVPDNGVEKNSMEQHKFSNMKELGNIAENLDRCRRQDSVYHDLSGKVVVDPSRKDIVNLRTGGRSAVVSKVYHEYQHGDVIEKVAGSFGKAGIEGHGYVYNAGDRIIAAVFFDNIEAIKDPASSKGIKLGAMFKNSYNKQNSVTGAGYFLRLECLNQMYFGNMIRELKFSERHTGSIVEALPHEIDNFTDNLLMRSKLVAKAVKLAAEVPVTFNNKEQRLQTMIALVDHQKVGKQIDERIDRDIKGEGLELDKWKIYNAITAVATHESMAMGVRERVEKLSEKVLSPDYHIFPAVLA
jgi:hypothetical protein